MFIVFFKISFNKNYRIANDIKRYANDTVQIELCALAIPCDQAGNGYANGKSIII